MSTAVTAVTPIYTKQDMSSFARAHEGPGINWSVQAGPGGTMIITEREQDRSVLAGTGAAS
jgi:hypothetical protein